VRIVVVVPKREFEVPVEAECLRPDLLADKSIDEIRELEIYEGSRRAKLGDLFEVSEEEGEGEGVRLVLRGDFEKVWRIGEGMASGEIVVEGNCGPYLGFRMKGGAIVVKGSAGSWLGGEMKGGTIEVYGDAGDHVGALLRGERSARGMSGGIIVIHGNAGAEIGVGMRKGTIIVDGNCGPLPGLRMSGGGILIRGDCEGKAGARMSGGRVVICGRAGGILPTFYIDEVVPKVKFKKEKLEGPFYVFVGDALANPACTGRLMVSVRNNPELKKYEELLATEGVEE